MKLTIIFLILFLSAFVTAQTYQKEWAAINKRLEAGDTVPVRVVNNFIAEYKSYLGDYPDNTTQLYSLLANNYSQLNNYPKAEENYLLSLKYAKSALDTSLKHIVELSLAILYQNNRNYTAAEKYYLRCMSGMSAVYGQTSREYTEIFYYYTSLLIGLGKYSDANPYIDALLYYYKTLDGENNLRYQNLRYYKGITLQHLGDYKPAIEIFRDEIKQKRTLKLGDTASYVTAYSNLGDIYREIGDYPEATENLEEAQHLYQVYRVNDSHLASTIENNLGLCYKGLDQPRKAEQAFDAAIAIYQKNAGTSSEAYCTTLSNKASLYNDLGRFGEASELLWTAIEIRLKYFGENNVNYANALGNLANSFFGAGFYQKSLDKNLEANTIYKSTVGEMHQAYANNLNSLSLCYQQLRNYKKAEEYKTQALEIIEKTVGKNHYRYMSFLVSSAEIYRLTGKNEQAEKSLKEAITLTERNFGKNHELYARAQFALAESYCWQKKYEAAAALYISGTGYYSSQMDDYFDAMSEGNQLVFIQQILPVFESYNNYVMLYRLAHPEKDLSDHLRRIFKYQMQIKSIQATRSAQLRKNVAASNNPALKENYNEWLALKNELMNRYKAMEPSEDNNDLLGRLSSLETNLKAGLKGFAQRKAVTYEDLKLSLADTEAAIEIFKVNEVVKDSQINVKYGALIATKKNAVPVLVIYKNGAELDSLGFDQYFSAVDNQKIDTFSYARYFQPLAASLKEIKRIYISSDGIFHKISYPGLYNPTTKKYLNEECEIFQTSNPGLLAAAHAKPVVISNAVLFGYPDYEYDFKKQLEAPETPAAEQLIAKRFGLTNLSKLPGTKAEVEGISKALKAMGWKTEIFTDQFASEANVRAVNGPGVLHIATHGFYLKDIETDDKRFLGFDKGAIKRDAMLRSGLILAGAGPATQDSSYQDSGNDGILTAAEAALLNLTNTDLVVLSACQTGLGDDFGTEGVAGLQRSFTIAGARNIVMSLWPVDDYATQLLMTELYKNYSRNQDVEGAFKLAQSEVKKKYPHPYYWAAFVLLKTFN